MLRRSYNWLRNLKSNEKRGKPIKMKSFEEALSQFTGLKAWNARIGIGTHVLVDFGKPVCIPDSADIQGEFFFWITGAPWRLEYDGEILAGSGQDELPTDTLECLNGDRISEIIAKDPYFDILIIWESGKLLRVFSENTDFDTIVFFLPGVTYGLDSTGEIDVEDR